MKTKSPAKSHRRLSASRGKKRRKAARPGPGLPTPKRILVPIDFSMESTRALKHAAVLAKQYGSAITLLHVVEPIHYICDYGYGPVTRIQPNEALMKSLRPHLHRLGKRHLSDVRAWDAMVRSGAAFTQITKVAKELAIDLILMPTRGLTDSKDVSLGSTAERVVRHAPCPVLTLRKPGRTGKPSKT